MKEREGMMVSNIRQLLLSLNFQVGLNHLWTVNLKRVVLAKIMVCPTWFMGWFNKKVQSAWKLILSLMVRNAKEGSLSLQNLAWEAVKIPWWLLMAELPTMEGKRCLIWVFNMHVAVQGMEMGVLSYSLTLLPEEGQRREMVNRIGWILREEAKALLPFEECPTPGVLSHHEYNNMEL